jgi:hypothetical protein
MATLGSAGCGSGDASPCTAKSTAIAGDRLTLLPGARLDRVGDGFVLLGLAPDGGQVLWASLTLDGQTGTLHSVELPAHQGQPWFAVTAGPGALTARVVIAYLAAPSPAPVATAATVAWLPLMTFTAPLDGDGDPSIPTRVGSLPDPATVPLEAAMGSAASGQRAGFVWGVRGGSARISAAVLDASGAPAFDTDDSATPGQGFGRLVGVAADDFDCLGFTPGHADLTTIYLDRSGTPPTPAAVVSEFGSVDAPTSGGSTSLRILLDKNPTEGRAGCVQAAPLAAGGYVVAWHAPEGTYTGEYSPPLLGKAFQSNLLEPNVRFSDGAPAVAGLGDVGGPPTGSVPGSLALVARRTAAVEGWAFGFDNHPRGNALAFPSRAGQIGAVSVQPIGRALFASYADAWPTPAGAPAAGERFLVEMTCP